MVLFGGVRNFTIAPYPRTMIIERFKQLLSDMIETKIPDVHLTTGSSPHIRKHSGEIELLESFDVLGSEDMDAIIREIVGHEKLEELRIRFEGDFSYAFGEHKFRVNVFTDVRGFGIAIRYIPTNIPTCKELTIPESVINLLHKDK